MHHGCRAKPLTASAYANVLAGTSRKKCSQGVQQLSTCTLNNFRDYCVHFLRFICLFYLMKILAGIIKQLVEHKVLRYRVKTEIGSESKGS